MLVSYNWLKDYLGDTTLSPQDIADKLTFHSFEVEEVIARGDDTVINVDILPNRASDCLCHRGLAREIAAITDTPLAHDPLTVAPELASTEAIDVDIADSNACPRFTATIMRGITVGPSPQWLQDRLTALGQRSINNIVDATNYVMYAIGQPLHAYDATLFTQVDGTWRFKVRYAREGEEVSLLAEGGKDEDRVVTCKGTELLIVDGSTDTPIGLAGVKGGRYAGVHAGTTDIIIEAAHFHPTLTRKTARGLGIVIDASKRFENEPSRELPLYAQSEIIKLISDIAGGVSEGTVDVYLEHATPPTVAVAAAQANSLLGLDVSIEDMAALITRTGSTVEITGDTLRCTGPFERTDLNIAEDFIEEIGRIYGYNHVASITPEAAPLLELNKRHYYSEKIREVLIGLGYSEVITSSFRKKDQIQLHNALASDKAHLRSSLSKNVSEALDTNAPFTDLLGTADTRIFELGTVFSKGSDGVTEHSSLAFGVRLKQSGYSGKEDKIIAKTIAALEDTLGETLTVTSEKGIVEVNLSVLLDTLPAPTAYDAVAVDAETVYQPFSSYPSVSRDIAMWVSDGVSKEAVETVLNDAAGALRVRTTFVDEFQKDGRTSLAFRLIFQATDRTLTDVEINEVMDSVNKAVATNNWEVR